VKALQTYRRLIEFPLAGVTHRERVFLGAALFARHGGRCDDTVLAPESRLLTPELARRAEVLGRTLRLAYRYAGCVPEILATARLRIDDNGLALETAGGAKLPDSEAVQARVRLLAKSLDLPVAEPMASALAR
jgi:exopolyphosphatase/guanosine-5'-triphosphate,3'-diphosphate pyrophosphatase